MPAHLYQISCKEYNHVFKRSHDAINVYSSTRRVRRIFSKGGGGLKFENRAYDFATTE